MKTIKDKLDDLLLKLKEAKTLEEAQKISKEIEDINADAVKVATALAKANSDAKESRESKQALQKELDEIKNKDTEEKTKDETKEETKETAKANPEMEKLTKQVADLTELMTAQKTKEDKAIKLESVNKKFTEILKTKKIPTDKQELFKKYVNINSFDPDAENLEDLIGEKVDTFQSDLNAESLKDTGKPYFPSNETEGTTGKKIAEARNAKSQGEVGGGVKAKPLPGMKTEE